MRNKHQASKEVAAPAQLGLPSETQTQTDTQLEITLNKTTVKTLDQLIAACEVDLSVWECSRFIANKWEMGSKDANNIPQTTPLFQVKAWFRRKVEVVSVAVEISALRDEAIKLAPRIRVPRLSTKSAEYMLELDIPDLHMGKLAWSRETGWEDYDSRIAKKCFNDALDSLIDQASTHKLSEVVLVVGNDLLNADNKTNATTHGTPQSTDGRYQKTYVETRKMLTEAIIQCRDVAPVRVIVVPGNHDEYSCFTLGDSLQCTFANTDGVYIDNEPTLRKYHQFGQVGIMWAHGNKGKHKDYPLLFATERRDIWGETQFHEVHVGHYHQTRTQEFAGTRVRVLMTLCATDEWHSSNGYVGNVRGAEGFIWHRETGLASINHYVVPGQGPRYVKAVRQ